MDGLPQYSLFITIWESKEPMIPQPGQTLEDRLSELEAAGKLLTHTKTVTVNITILNKRILGLDSAINNFKLQFRDETNYPYLKGRIIPTLV